MKKFIISLMIFTLLLYVNINLNKVANTKIMEHSHEIMNSRQSKEQESSFTNSRRTRNGKPVRTTSETITITPTSTSEETSENNTKYAFPSLTNCSRKDYIRQVKSGSPYRARNNLYICRKKHQTWRNNTRWPMVLRPTNGSVLKALPIHHQDPEVLRLLREEAVVQAQRVARLTAACLRHPELLNTSWKFKTVWDTSRTPPLIYCPIYKVASTTWSVYFLRLANVKNTKTKETKGDVHVQMSLKFPPPKTTNEKTALFPKSLRFIVVRHPFTRLLSAYRDKIDKLKPKPFQPYFLDLQHAIIKRYRSPYSNITSLTPTFPEFVDYVIDSTENFTTATEWMEHVVSWVPYWVQCAVCSSDFQVIIKLETMDRDVQFLAEVAQLKEIQNAQEWRNKSKKKSLSSTAPSDYFKQLSKRQMQLLYQRYKLDFDIFGYSIQDYLTYART